MGVTVRNLVRSFGPLTVIHEISFDVGDGEFVTLLGPSGCGKTTTLRCIAGLDTPNSGSIAINGHAVSDPARNLFVPPHERDLGMVFQSYAVWPHLTVAENVAFPLTIKGGRDIASGVAWALDIVGMTKLASRRPSELSGGQQQRVALARAIAARPQLLLFDEPLSNLDARLRDRTRLEISRIQRELKVPTLYVTHDQTEALSMSDRVIVMELGRIVQEGDPRELYQRPVNRFVADFIGNANFLHVQRVGRQWQLEDGSPVEVDPATDRDDGRSKIALLRPEAIRLDQTPVQVLAGQNRLTGRVVGGMYLGPHVEYIVEVGADRLRAYSRSVLAPGSPATLTVNAQDCRLVDDVPQPETRYAHAR
ncbi:MAG: Iron(III) transport system ATP-binding protein [Bradyrhizobium sp.]|nr:Iron(III) transport system ATP-binding protein [Bradyrhizobium sp.]